MIKVKVDSVSRYTLESMEKGDCILLLLPDTSKAYAGRVNINTYSNISGREYTAPFGESKNELIVTRTK